MTSLKLEIELSGLGYTPLPLYWPFNTSTEVFVEQVVKALCKHRVRAIAASAWRGDARRLSLRAPWKIPIHFSVAPAPLPNQITLCCILETTDAYVSSEADKRTVAINHSVQVHLAAPRARRIGQFAELARSAALHEFDECLLVDNEILRDPHRPGRQASGGESAVQAMDGESSAPRKARLTLTVEQDGLVLEEDFILQAPGEHDRAFIERGVAILEVLKYRSAILPSREAQDLDTVKYHELSRGHFDLLETLVQDRSSWIDLGTDTHCPRRVDLGDTVLAGLIVAHGLAGADGDARHEDADWQWHSTKPGEILRHYITTARAELDTTIAIQSLLAILKDWEP